MLGTILFNTLYKKVLPSNLSNKKNSKIWSSPALKPLPHPQKNNNDNSTLRVVLNLFSYNKGHSQGHQLNLTHRLKVDNSSLPSV